MDDVGLKPFRWTAEEFYLALDAGAFIDRRVQLIDGEILEMASMKNLHALGVAFVDDVLSREFGPGYWVRVQMSLDLSPHSVPDPDIAVIVGGMRSHRGTNNPTTALLLVEVSDTTLRYDRRVKKRLYAASAIDDIEDPVIRDARGCVETQQRRGEAKRQVPQRTPAKSAHEAHCVLDDEAR